MGKHVLLSSALHSLTAFGQGTFPRGEGLVPDKSKFEYPSGEEKYILHKTH